MKIEDIGEMDDAIKGMACLKCKERGRLRRTGDLSERSDASLTAPILCLGCDYRGTVRLVRLAASRGTRSRLHE